MESVELGTVDDCGLVVEENFLAIGETVDNDCSSVPQANLENTLLVFVPPRLWMKLASSATLTLE